MDTNNFKYFLLLFFLNFSIFTPSNLYAEEDLGQKLFVEKRCVSCHVIGRGRFAGPDLYHILDKYSDEEIISWIINPQSMYKKYSKTPINDGYPPMPNLNVHRSEAKLLLSYIKEIKKEIKRNSKVRISGKINNFTTDKFLDNQEIELMALLADKVLSNKKTLIKNGNFQFSDLPGNSAYKIILMHDGIEYSTDKFYFLPTENEKKINLTVFDTTQDKKEIKTDSVHLIITYDKGSKSITVAEIINIKNSSRNIFIGSNDFKEKIRKINSYSLFPDATSLGFPHRGEETFVVSDNKVTDTLPMPPGNRRVVLTYSIKLNLLSTTISKIFFNDIDSLTIIVPENILSFDIQGLEYTKKETHIKELVDEKYTTYSIKNIKKGDTLNLKFKKYDIFLNTKSVVGIIFLIFILTALGFTIFKKGVKK